MRVVRSRVIAGRIVIEDVPLDEGSTVTVPAPERDEVFVLDAEAEASLLVAMGAADRDEVITGEQLMDRLRDRA